MVGKFKGKFDRGYEMFREETLTNEEDGHVAADTELLADPIGDQTGIGLDGKSFRMLDVTSPWDSL